MLKTIPLDDILDAYISTVVPAMIRRGYHLQLAKGGPDYPHLSEQSLFTHIINGVFAWIRLIRFLQERGIIIPHMDERNLRRSMALYTIHEVHKSPDLERFSASEFSIPLERLQEEYRALRLEEFAGEVNPHLLRAVNVHQRSPRHGDVLLSNAPDASLLYKWVRIADAMASCTTVKEAHVSLRDRLSDLGPAFAPQTPPGQFALYFHELSEVRGVLTNTIHQVVARLLENRWRFYPLLFFATGTLYIGPACLDPQKTDDLIPEVAQEVLRVLTDVGEGRQADLIGDALRREKYDFERHVYAFAKPEVLLEAVLERVLASRHNPRTPLEEIRKIAEKRKDLPSGWQETIEPRLGIRLLDPHEHKAFNERWSCVYHYLLYANNILRDLSPTENRVDWLAELFSVPSPFRENLRQEADIWALGGLAKYVLIIAYHFLRGQDFADRPAEALPLEKVLRRLHRRVLQGMDRIDTEAGRQAIWAELGLQEDLEVYLREHFHLSFDPATSLSPDGLASYLAPKSRGHTGKVCSLCNRASKYVRELRTGILDDFGRVFSNRVLPAREAPQGNRLWCPVCHLEAILRKMAGLGLPPNADYGKSYRIYLYLLPTFSFTPEHLQMFERWLHSFHRITALPVRDYGSDWGIPHYWLERRALDPEWLDALQKVLEREAKKIAGWGGRQFVGERLMTGPIRGQPHYYLIYWEKAARRGEKEDTRIATRSVGQGPVRCGGHQRNDRLSDLRHGAPLPAGRQRL